MTHTPLRLLLSIQLLLGPRSIPAYFQTPPVLGLIQRRVAEITLLTLDVGEFLHSLALVGGIVPVRLALLAALERQSRRAHDTAHHGLLRERGVAQRPGPRGLGRVVRCHCAVPDDRDAFGLVLLELDVEDDGLGVAKKDLALADEVFGCFGGEADSGLGVADWAGDVEVAGYGFRGDFIPTFAVASLFERFLGGGGKHCWVGDAVSWVERARKDRSAVVYGRLSLWRESGWVICGSCESRGGTHGHGEE